MSAQLPILQALITTLRGDAALSGAVTGIYSGEAPQPTALPYIVVGEHTERDHSAHDLDGAESTAALHIWSGKSGNREVLTLYGHIRRLLHFRPIPITGHVYEGGTVELVSTTADPDGEAMHGVARYRIRTEAE